MGCLKLTYQTTESPLKVVYKNLSFEQNNAQRFLSIDPLADMREWLSPYNYVQNNPLLRIDPDGKADSVYHFNNGEEFTIESNSETDTHFYVEENEDGQLVSTEIGTTKADEGMNVMDGVEVSRQSVETEREYIDGWQEAILENPENMEGRVEYSSAVINGTDIPKPPSSSGSGTSDLVNYNGIGIGTGGNAESVSRLISLMADRQSNPEKYNDEVRVYLNSMGWTPNKKKDE